MDCPEETTTDSSIKGECFLSVELKFELEKSHNKKKSKNPLQLRFLRNIKKEHSANILQNFQFVFFLLHSLEFHAKSVEKKYEKIHL